MYDPILAEKINEILFGQFGKFCGEVSEHIAEISHEYYKEEGHGVEVNGKHTA